MEAIILVAALCILIFLGAPIGIALAVLPVVYILFTGELPLSTVPYQMYEALASPPLIAVPLFLLTGELMNTGNITDRLLPVANSLVEFAADLLKSISCSACSSLALADRQWPIPRPSGQS
jgi:C4-dicarboxylate transporter DctM subunit